MSTKALREKRARAVEQARAVLEKAETEGRVMTQEENRAWDGWMSEVDGLKETIDRAERLETEERALEASLGRRTTETATRTTTNDALRSWLLNESSKELQFSLRSSAPTTLDVTSWDERAQSIGTATAGGNLVPRSFVNELEVALLSFGGMRQVASVIRTAGGQDLPWPTENDTTNEGVILGENTAVAEQDLVFSQATLKAYKYSSKMIRVPVELLQDSAIDLGVEIGRRLGERIGRITNKHFTIGTGTGQPTGIVTASAVGVTGAVGNTTTITYDALVDLQHSVDPDYRTNARFMFHDTTLKAIKKLKDSQGRPLWAAGIAEREPDSILGQAYIINQAMPVMAANAKSIVFGDLSKYKIRDVQDVILMRLNERFADNHQVAFLAFSRHDGLLLDAGTNPVKHYANSAT